QVGEGAEPLLARHCGPQGLSAEGAPMAPDEPVAMHSDGLPRATSRHSPCLGSKARSRAPPRPTMHLLWRLFVPLPCLLSLLLTGTVAAQAKPHIVLFISDDHGQLDSTPYGATDVQTPNMQRLAKAGMTFTHAFAASPSCAPSRASLLTGLMPNRHGAMVNHAPPKDEVRKWPAYLRRLGYRCAAFAKAAHYGQ